MAVPVAGVAREAEPVNARRRRSGRSSTSGSRGTGVLAVATSLTGLCVLAALAGAVTAGNTTTGHARTRASPGIKVTAVNPRPGQGSRLLADDSSDTAADRVGNLRRELAVIPITYHSPNYVMTGAPINVYHIYYGNWSTSGGTATKNVLDYMTANLGPTAWWGIETQYYDSTGAYVSPTLNLAGSVVLTTTPYITAMQASDVPSIVGSVLDAGTFPADNMAVYVVYTSADIGMTSGVCVGGGSGNGVWV